MKIMTGGLMAALAASVVLAGPANADPSPVLGSSWTGNDVGYGSAKPASIGMGGCANSVDKITWDSWGGSTAHGRGIRCEVFTDGGKQYDVPASLTASDLGMCHGVLAYRQLSFGGAPIPICD